VKLGRVALDGTKVKADASKHKAMSYGRMDEREAVLEAEVARILEEAEAVDAVEDARYGDARGDELPKALRTREGRLRAIREARAALEAEAKERTGDPEAVPEPKAQRNFTDPDSRIMLSKPDGFIYGYNAQAVVDEAHQIIVATELTTEATDTGALPDLVDGVETNTGRRPKRFLADAGYQSDTNLEHLEDRKIDAYIAVRRDKHSSTPAPAPRGRIPRDLSRRGHHEEGSCPLCEEEGHRRAGLRADQGGHGLPQVQPAGQGEGDCRVASRLCGPRPRQAVPQWPRRPGHRWLGPSEAPQGPRMGLMGTSGLPVRTSDRSRADRSRVSDLSEACGPAFTNASS